MDSFDFSDTNMVIELVRDDVYDVVLRKRLEFVSSVRDRVAEITKVEPELTLFRSMLENAKDEVKLTGVAILANLASHDVTKSVPLLIETLKSGASEVRIRSVKALMGLHYGYDTLLQCLYAGAVKVLLEMAQGQETGSAIQALRQFDDKRREWRIMMPEQEHVALLEALNRLKEVERRSSLSDTIRRSNEKTIAGDSVTLLQENIIRRAMNNPNMRVRITEVGPKNDPAATVVPGGPERIRETGGSR